MIEWCSPWRPTSAWFVTMIASAPCSPAARRIACRIVAYVLLIPPGERISGQDRADHSAIDAEHADARPREARGQLGSRGDAAPSRDPGDARIPRSGARRAVYAGEPDGSPLLTCLRGDNVPSPVTARAPLAAREFALVAAFGSPPAHPSDVHLTPRRSNGTPMEPVRRKILVLLLLFTLTPSASELVETVAHVALHGDYVHADDGRHPSSPAGDEHGCSPLFHTCGCHSNALGATTVAQALKTAAPPPRDATVDAPATSHEREPEPPPHRPPIA